MPVARSAINLQNPKVRPSIVRTVSSNRITATTGYWDARAAASGHADLGILRIGEAVRWTDLVPGCPRPHHGVRRPDQARPARLRNQRQPTGDVACRVYGRDVNNKVEVRGELSPADQKTLDEWIAEHWVEFDTLEVQPPSLLMDGNDIATVEKIDTRGLIGALDAALATIRRGPNPR